MGLVTALAEGWAFMLPGGERAWLNDKLLLNRPDDNEDDRKDDMRLTQTHLEQIASNVSFRPVAEAFQKTLYLHLVPQLLKHPNLGNRDAAGEDPFGLRFLERVMTTPEKTRKARLKKIEQALRIAVSELKDLTVAVRCPSRLMREALLWRDEQSGRLFQGPDYNGTLARFVNGQWDMAAARLKCRSLERFFAALTRLEDAHNWHDDLSG